MPPANTLVWIKRQKGSLYLGMRADRPFSTNPDVSQECHWYASPSSNAFNTDVHGNWHPGSHFSDLTVQSWMPVQIPDEHGNKEKPVSRQLKEIWEG